MALCLWWRCSWFCVFLLTFLGSAVTLSYADGSYYEYSTRLQSSGGSQALHLLEGSSGPHTIRRRQLFKSPPQPLKQDIDEKITKHMLDVANNGSDTVATLVSTNVVKTGGNYITGTNTSMTEDANRTSQPKNLTELPDPTPPASVNITTDTTNTTPTTTITPSTTTTSLAGVDMPVDNTTVLTPPQQANTSIPAEKPGDDSDLMISKFLDDMHNSTLNEHNVTETHEDHHQFYNSTLMANNGSLGQVYWVNMSKRGDVQVNEMLSKSHRRAATVMLSFDFPFYGHLVRNVTIATGGFLYTGEYVHSWLAATQYIAPLMANFDTSLSNYSFVKYVDNGSSFTVQWERVVLQDKPMSGDFTFQATLHKSGDIVFVYRTVPPVIDSIQDEHHPVKVGLSDAYIIDRTIFFVRRKTIYEYHRLDLKRQDIKNWTVIYLHALPTCLGVKDCESCLGGVNGFKCNWCPGTQRCSNGMDRYRQEWLLKGCDKYSQENISMCSAGTPSEPLGPVSKDPDVPEQASVVSPDMSQYIEPAGGSRIGDIPLTPLIFEPSPAPPQTSLRPTHKLNCTLDEVCGFRGDHRASMGISGILGILFLVAFVGGMSVWALYAYRNPQTASGQFLIRYRPSQWNWKRGEARYTAATIHM